MLMEKARFKRIRSFGFAGGFSALPEINERDIPLMHTEIAGKVPPEKYLRIPSPLPIDWKKMKNEVLLPYFRDFCTGSPGDPLGKRLEKWYVKLQSSR